MKKYLSFMVIACLLLACCSCSNGSGSGSRGAAAKIPGTIVKETKSSITIIDQAERTVTVKRPVKSIALCYRVAIRPLLSLGQGKKIKGIGKTEPFLEQLQPSLKHCKEVGQGVADLEALAALKPDVFFHKATDVQSLDAVQQLGIPAIGISVETPEQMRQAITIMGEVCGAEKKANTLLKYYDKRLAASKKRIAPLTGREKKTAIIMGAALGKVANGAMLQSVMIQQAGGVNMARGVNTPGLWPTVGIEQVFQWNPDYIFISNSESANYTARDILKDPTWSALKAVKEKHVYTMPAAQDSWEFPGPVSVLGIDYMMMKMYPDLISEKMLEKEVNQFYQLSYGKTFTRRQLGY